MGMKTFNIMRRHHSAILLIVATGYKDRQPVTTSPNIVFILANDLIGFS
jgi:hypothetical protein